MTKGGEPMVRENNRTEHVDQCRRHLAFLQRLTHAFAKTWDHEDIVTIFFAEFHSVMDVMVIGLAGGHPHRVWIWSDSQHGERADAVRARVRTRLERPGQQSGWTAVAREDRRRGRSRHLSLVPKSGASIHNQNERLESVQEVKLAVGSSGEGMLYIERAPGYSLTDEDRQLAQAAADLLALALANADAHRCLRESDLRDPLTGLFNRAAFDGMLHRALHAGSRYGISACLLVLDLDYLRIVNERLGHMTGDGVLKDVASLVGENVRDVDSVCRYGGGAFAVVLPHTSIGQARVLAERMRTEVERRAFEVDGGHVRLTTSIGLAASRHSSGESVNEWWTNAESALHEAKARGRNCVVTHAATPVAPAYAAMSLVA